MMTVEEFKANLGITRESIKEAIVNGMNKDVIEIGNKLKEYVEVIGSRKIVFECKIIAPCRAVNCSFVFKNGNLRKFLIDEVTLKYDGNGKVSDAYVGWDLTKYEKMEMVEENVELLSGVIKKDLVQKMLRNYLMGK